MANKAKLHSPLHSNLKALVLQCVVEHCCGEELSPFWYQLQVLQFSVHLIDLLSVLLRRKGLLGFRKLSWVRWAAGHQTVTMTFSGASLALGNALELLLCPTTELVDAGCHIHNTSQSN